MSENSISKKNHKTDNQNMNEGADWSQESLEYLFNNKIWLPNIVSHEIIRTKIILSIFKLQQRFFIVIPLLLPVIDVLTDHIFAILNAVKYESPAVAAIGWALLWNLLFGPMLFGNFTVS